MLFQKNLTNSKKSDILTIYLQVKFIIQEAEKMTKAIYTIKNEYNIFKRTHIAEIYPPKYFKI